MSQEDKIKAAAELLGTTPERLINLLGLTEEEEAPTGIEGFYFNPEVFRKLHSIDTKGLRELVVPNLRRLRR